MIIAANRIPKAEARKGRMQASAAKAEEYTAGAEDRPERPKQGRRTGNTKRAGRKDNE